MASYNELNALIDAYINRNGVQAITGQILNGVLKAMVEQLGRGYTIMGAAIPTTDPGTPDGPECYFASETGTYTDFDGLQVAPGELALLCYTPTDGWTKATIYEGFRQVGATIDGNVGTPSVGVSYAGGVLSFDFHNMKGDPGQNGQDGQDGAAAGFGTIDADITGGVGTPGVTVESSGPATAKNLQFHFTNLKGETGVTSVVATVDNTTGNPACTVSLVGQQLTLAFSGLKGAQGDTGSSVDYPFTIVNNLTTNDATKGLSAAQGVVLDGKVSQLEAKLIENASVPMAYELPSKTYINASGSILASTTANVCLFPVVPGKEYRVIVPKSGNTATKTIAFGQYLAQTTGLTVGAYTGNSARLEATVTVPAGMRYMFFTFIKSEGDVTVHTNVGIDEVVAEQGEEIGFLDETLLEKKYMTFPGTVTIEDGYRFDTDGSKIAAAGYKIYTVSAVGYSRAEVQKMVFGSSAKVSCVTYDASSNIVEIYPVADTVDLDLTGVSTVSYVSYYGNPVFVPYVYYKFTDLILPPVTRIEGKFWNCSAIGQTAALAVSVSFNSIDKYQVNAGESYMLYGKGGTSSSRLWALLDADGKAIDIASSGETATLEEPKLYTVTNPAAAFLILSSEVGYDYGIIPDTPVGNEYRDKMLTDNYVGQQKNTIVLAGASFAYPNNRWFGKLIERYGGTGYNYAVSGSTIATLAQALHDGTFFTDVAFDDVDVLMIMYTHNNDVADQTGILEDYTQYTFPASGLTPAQCWDYVLKKYTADCLACKDDANSKWYNYPMGKPCNIVVLTHWHDARTIFNNSIRTLRDKWGFHLVELDKNIGFTKNQSNPVDGNQISRLYAQDTETIDGVVYGWHPLRSGNGSEVIQPLIARIVFDELTRFF